MTKITVNSEYLSFFRTIPFFKPCSWSIEEPDATFRGGIDFISCTKEECIKKSPSKDLNPSGNIFDLIKNAQYADFFPVELNEIAFPSLDQGLCAIKQDYWLIDGMITHNSKALFVFEGVAAFFTALVIEYNGSIKVVVQPYPPEAKYNQLWESKDGIRLVTI